MTQIKTEGHSHKMAAFEAHDDIPLSPKDQPSLGQVVNNRMGRRQLLKRTLATSVLATVAAQTAKAVGLGDAKSHLNFKEIQHGVDETHHVAEGYDANILIRWGDPVLKDAPQFTPQKPSSRAQSLQFGYNNDFIGYIPLPFNSENSDHGLLCINHEYTSEEVMFPGMGGDQKEAAFKKITKEHVFTEMAAHGGSIVEVIKRNGRWKTVYPSLYNRRVNALDTKMQLSGPVAGSDRVKTSADSEGRHVIGTFNNCAGGITPWGTYLMAEENFHGYFMGELPKGHSETSNHTRYGVPAGAFAWGKYVDRFDLSKEPNEPNRYGWVVEVDPFNKDWHPRKRTALGRFRHEGATAVVNKDGRVVVYSGDDSRFEYLYKFVSARRYNPKVRIANLNILDTGTLYVAKFHENGKVQWLPIVYGQGPLTVKNGFKSQADVLIETRRAADLLGATPMDRPEDVETSPASGKVYVMLTNNHKRKPGQENPANPRAENLFGHIVEITPLNGDHNQTESSWDILVQCGDPTNPKTKAQWNSATSENGWFASPDNCALDKSGRLWIATDQGSNWKLTGTADGLYALETEGKARGTSKMFFRVPIGAELCGPCFTPDAKTLFVAVQHPATDGTKDYKGFERESTFEDPATRWPDFDKSLPPRPSVVVITQKQGKEIGTV